MGSVGAPLGEYVMQKAEVKSTSRIQELQKNLERKQARDSEKVTGIFKNLEAPGNVHRFAIKLYKGDPVEVYEMWDGERYTIPRGVARHLSTNCYYTQYKHLPGEFGENGIRAAYNDGRLRAANMQEAKKVYRFAFHSLEFTDEDPDMIPSTVVQVTTR